MDGLGQGRLADAVSLVDVQLAALQELLDDLLVGSVVKRKVEHVLDELGDVLLADQLPHHARLAQLDGLHERRLALLVLRLEVHLAVDEVVEHLLGRLQVEGQEQLLLLDDDVLALQKLLHDLGLVHPDGLLQGRLTLFVRLIKVDPLAFEQTVNDFFPARGRGVVQSQVKQAFDVDRIPSRLFSLQEHVHQADLGLLFLQVHAHDLLHNAPVFRVQLVDPEVGVGHHEEGGLAKVVLDVVHGEVQSLVQVRFHG